MLKIIAFIKKIFCIQNTPLQSESDAILVNEMKANKGL